MLKFYLNKKILAGFLLALSILAWLAFASFLNTRGLIHSNRMVTHTMDVLYNTERVLSIVTNIELGQRGYALTANDEFLKVQREATSNVHAHLDSLLALTKDNEQQQERLRKIKIHVDSLIAFASEAIRLRDIDYQKAVDINSSLKGKRVLDEIRSLIKDVEQAEHTLLSSRNSLSETKVSAFNTTFVALLAATGVLILLIYFAINHILGKRFEAQKRLQKASLEIEDLYDNAPCGYHSLDANGLFINVNNTLVRWLGYRKDEVIEKLTFKDVIAKEDWDKFNASYENFKLTGSVYDIEFNLMRKDGSSFPVLLNAVAMKDSRGRFVKSRSTTFDNTERKKAENKIMTLNQELEAFTYSVSHDLRAPLRSIDGYSQILQEDYGKSLDEEGKRVLSVIMNNARRMGKLIDDLLEFARLGRKEVSRSRVDMRPMVEGIINELTEVKSDRAIKLTVHDLAPSVVDVDMIRQVWLNLLSNAIKYSGKREVAEIEVSSVENSTEVVYCVRDNGVGFDMQYQSKLFGVFQRLHRIQDYSGTGVGLAIVKRIVDRHRGKVWAEAAVDKGAAFFFSIPKL